MDKRCTICTHENHREIDNALIAGKSLRSLAAHYGLSVSALSRHTKHLRRTLANGAEEAQQMDHAKLLDKLDLFDFRLDRIYQKAQEYNHFHICLGCVQEAVRIFTLRERIRHTPPGKF